LPVRSLATRRHLHETLRTVCSLTGFLEVFVGFLNYTLSHGEKIRGS